MALKEFKIIPLLGRKTDVPADDKSLLQMVGENVAVTHDVGGLNFDLVRDRGSCSKSFGYTQWSSAATADATRCQGLYEFYDGSNRCFVYVDNGSIYVYNLSTYAPEEKSDIPGTTFAQNPEDLYTFMTIGIYMVFTDRGANSIQKWAYGDTNLSNLIASGTNYRFRYIGQFQRRVIGAYCTNETDGDISVRWSTDWPNTAISSLYFPDANQLYVPNDDPILGCASLGTDRFYIVCENSIQQMVYYPDYTSPFRMYTIVPKQGFASHHSIISLGDRLYGFNKNYGFVEYRGTTELPYGNPISSSIEQDIRDIHPDTYKYITGCFVPMKNQLVWNVTMSSGTYPTHLFFYDLRTGQWTIEDKPMRFVNTWRSYADYTWEDLITALGGAGALWSAAGTNSWSYYTSNTQRLVYANTNGQLYYAGGETLAGSALDGYRIEPILDFGDSKRKKLLTEIWFDIGNTGNYSIDIYHRMGDTAGAVIADSWTSLGSISCNSPTVPALRNFAKSGRLHQLKWQTNLGSEKFKVNGITFRFEYQSEN